MTWSLIHLSKTTSDPHPNQAIIFINHVQLVYRFKTGMSRQPPPDSIAAQAAPLPHHTALKNLLPFIRPHWRSGLIGAVLIIFSSVLVFPQPMIYRFLVDDVILAQQLDLLPIAVLLMAGIRIISMGVSVLQQYYVLNFEQSVSLDIQKSLLDHTLRLPKEFFDTKETGYLISRISSDVQGLQWFFSSTIVYLFTNLIRFVGGIIFLFYLEWRLALVCLVVLPLLVISVRYFSKRMYNLSYSSMEQNATIMKRLQETITSVPLIKAFSTENRESSRVMSAFEGARQLTMEQNAVNSVAGMVINTAPDLARAVVLVAGAYLVILGNWTLGSLLAFQSYLGYVFGPAQVFANANLSLQNALASLERVSALMEILPEDSGQEGRQVERLMGAVSSGMFLSVITSRNTFLRISPSRCNPGNMSPSWAPAV